MNEEEKYIYAQCEKDELSSDEDTCVCRKVSADSSLKSYKMSSNSTSINKRASDHNLKHSDLSYAKKLMSYSYKKFNAKLKNYEKENEIFHRQQGNIQLTLPTDELNSSRFHSKQRIHGIQGSVIFNSQEIPFIKSSKDHAYSNTRFSDDCVFSSSSYSDNRTFLRTSFCDNRADTSTRFSDNSNFASTSFPQNNRAAPSTSFPQNNRSASSTSFSDNRSASSTSFSDNRSASSTSFSDSRADPNTSFSDSRADPNTSFSDNCNFPSTGFSDNCAVPSTSVLDIWAFPSTSRCDDQVVRSKSFSDNKELQRTRFSDGKMTSRVSFKNCFSMGEEDFAGQMPTDLHNLLENLELEASSDNESVEVNVSDSSDYESTIETSPRSVLKSKKPAKDSDSPVNKLNEERKKESGKTLKSLSNLARESLSPIQKFHLKGNSETVVTETEKSKEDLSNEDHEKYQANRKRRISENHCHSRGVFDLACGLKKFKPL